VISASRLRELPPLVEEPGLDHFFRQRVGNDVSVRDTSTTLFGVKQSMPLAIGVTGLTGMLAYEGEYKLARAAAAAGVPYTFGNTNFAPISSIKQICGDLLWRQTYPLKNRAAMDHVLQTTRDAGVRVLAISTAVATGGERASRNRAIKRECERFGLSYDHVLATNEGTEFTERVRARSFWDYCIIAGAVGVFAWLGTNAAVPALHVDYRWLTMLVGILLATALGMGWRLWKLTRFG